MGGYQLCSVVASDLDGKRWFWYTHESQELGIPQRSTLRDKPYLTREAACAAAKEYVVKCMAQKAQP